jgi:hypothetical protein
MVARYLRRKWFFVECQTAQLGGALASDHEGGSEQIYLGEQAEQSKQRKGWRGGQEESEGGKKKVKKEARALYGGAFAQS